MLFSSPTFDEWRRSSKKHSNQTVSRGAEGECTFLESRTKVGGFDRVWVLNFDRFRQLWTQSHPVACVHSCVPEKGVTNACYRKADTVACMHANKQRNNGLCACLRPIWGSNCLARWRTFSRFCGVGDDLYGNLGFLHFCLQHSMTKCGFLINELETIIKF